MRAILPIATSDNRLSNRADDLKEIAQKNHWLVADGTRATEIKEAVFADVSTSDVARVREQYVISLEKANHTVTGILGIVPGDNRIEIRLVGLTTAEIKSTCSEMVEMFRKSDREAAEQHGVHFGFSFPLKIGIFSRAFKEQTWSGEVNPSTPFRYAFGEEKGQARAFVIGIIIFIIGLLVTIPDVAHLLFSNLTKEYYDWLEGYMSRIASAGFFAAIVAYLNLQLRAQELKREGAIIWRHV